MRWFSNLPKETPFPLLDEEPSLSTIVSNFRPLDYLTIAGVGLGFPFILHTLEQRKPTIHPKVLPKVMMIQVPFFLLAGTWIAGQNVVFRFWGWRENHREAASYKPLEKPSGYYEQDW